MRARPKTDAARLALQENPGLSDLEVAKALGCSREVVKVARSELVAEGVLATRGEMRARSRAAAEAAARRRARGGPAYCSVCALAAHRPKGALAPIDWEPNPMRCAQCVATGRMPAPVKVRFVEPGSLRRTG
jgi:hypothetical protein